MKNKEVESPGLPSPSTSGVSAKGRDEGLYPVPDFVVQPQHSTGLEARRTVALTIAGPTHNFN